MNETSQDSLYTERSRVRRGPKRADYDKQTAYRILDETLMCHIAQVKDGQPFITPTCHWREGDYLYWHAHLRARNTAGAAAEPVCINVSQLDGLVLARSAFHHSVNYRSLTLFGVPELVEDKQHKEEALKCFLEKVSPGRWETLRPVKDSEVNATSVVRIRIDEGSAKIRTGPPIDDEADYSWPIWAGVLPLQRQWGAPQADPDLTFDGESLPIPPQGI